MTDEAVEALVMEAIGHGLDNDLPKVLDIFDRIHEARGAPMLFGVAAALGQVGKHVMGKLEPLPPGHGWGIHSLVPDIDALPPSEIFPARYFVAWANGDREMAQELLWAEHNHPDPNRFPDALVGLFGLVVSMLRALELQKKKDGSR